MLHRLRGHSPATLAALLTWKLRQALRAAADRAGGSRRLARAAQRRERRWLQEFGEAGMAAWLARAGAGRFWFEPEDPEAWARQTWTAEDSALAAASAAGIFELLGAPPTAYGATPDWRRDLYTGARWPLLPASRIPLVRGDGSDIRTVWELSRGYHLLALARARVAEHREEYAAVFVRHVESFIEQNPVGLGPHWASPMDVAIRSANWSLAAPLFARAAIGSRTWARMLAYLHAGGRYLERHLEWHPVFRGNHYVANGVGLVYLGTLFRATRDGDRWLRAGSRIVQQELHYQVGADGVSFEGSIAYHRLVTELFGYAAALLRRNDPAFPAAAVDERLAGMHRFIAAYLQPDGRAPMIGDADDGRLHLVCAASGREPRRHALGLPPPADAAVSAPPDGAAAFPHGGFYVLRDGADHAVLRCGAVGLRGAGSHDHNDQLSFELVVAGRRVVTDSGTYAYTRDLRARHRFRSVAAHSAIQLGDEEPNPIVVGAPWRVLADRTRSRALACDDDGATLRFLGEHHGYGGRASGAICRRELRFVRASRSWQLSDSVDGSGEEEVVWRLQLAPGPVELREPQPGRWVAVLEPATAAEPRVSIEFDAPAGMSVTVRESVASDAYGVLHDRAVLEGSGRVPLPLRITCTIRALHAP